MIILAVGDVVGASGLAMVEAHLSSLRRTHRVDFTVVNGENCDMLGIRPEQAQRLLQAGADVVTLGNHTWRRKEIAAYLDKEPRLLRPANFPVVCPGARYFLTSTAKGTPLLVVSLVGRCFMDFHSDDPFSAMDRILEETGVRLVVVDIHAEATSEKAALAHYLQDRVSVVFGTHTHVQTADEAILPGGAGFITDIGMTGPYEATVLGVKSEQSIASFRGFPPSRYELAPGPCKLEGALFFVDEATGRCEAAERLSIRD